MHSFGRKCDFKPYSYKEQSGRLWHSLLDSFLGKFSLILIYIVRRVKWQKTLHMGLIISSEANSKEEFCSHSQWVVSNVIKFDIPIIDFIIDTMPSLYIKHIGGLGNSFFSETNFTQSVLGAYSEPYLLRIIFTLFYFRRIFSNARQGAFSPIFCLGKFSKTFAHWHN